MQKIKLTIGSHFLIKKIMDRSTKTNLLHGKSQMVIKEVTKLYQTLLPTDFRKYLFLIQIQNKDVPINIFLRIKRVGYLLKKLL